MRPLQRACIQPMPRVPCEEKARSDEAQRANEWQDRCHWIGPKSLRPWNSTKPLLRKDLADTGHRGHDVGQRAQ